jgi:hypothetical protein
MQRLYKNPYGEEDSTAFSSAIALKDALEADQVKIVDLSQSLRSSREAKPILSAG